MIKIFSITNIDRARKFFNLLLKKLFSFPADLKKIQQSAD